MRVAASKEFFRVRSQWRRARQLEVEEAARARQLKEEQIALSLSRQPPDPLSKFDALKDALRKAPRLAEDPRYVPCLQFIESKPEFVREPRNWIPRGKGVGTLFRSLCSHLFALYPMPEFLWSAFEVKPGVQPAGLERQMRLADFARFVARGGSVFESVRLGLMPAHLTRKMCHEFMKGAYGDASIDAAVRRSQILVSGGSLRMVTAWMGTQAGDISTNSRWEAFWAEAIAWFCKIPMLDHSQIGPMVDYLVHRREREIGFSMKGRSALAVIKGMEEWHGMLAKERFIKGKTFEPSGFTPGDYDRTTKGRDGEPIKSLWHMREILTDRELNSEGRAMRHCVYSYGSSIERGNCSIWSLTEEDDLGHWRRLTVEVRKDARLVVQARAVCNRGPSPRDLVVLRMWAGQNDLNLRM